MDMEADKVMRVVDDESAKRYVDSGGSRCLYCGSGDIGGSSVEIDMGGAFQCVRCARCGGEWRDYYRLAGVSAGSYGYDR